MIYALSDCSIEDAIRVVSQYKIGSWASVYNQDSTETFVIKTSDDECIVHKDIRFDTKKNEFYMRFNDKYYKWDTFWNMMEETYNLDENSHIIVEEDELY